MAILAGSEFGCRIERDEITILDGLAPVGEIGIPAGADVNWVGNQIAVLAPDGTLFVVDPSGPTVTSEHVLAPESRIAAATEHHLLVTHRDGVSLVELGARTSVARVPVRLRPELCAASGHGEQFLIASGDVIEEWSASSRSPVRRFHLDRACEGGWLGGNARHVWFAAGDELLAIKRDGTAPPSRIALPEPIAFACGDASVVAIIGAESRRAWLVRIGDRSVMPLCDAVAEVALGRDAALVLSETGSLEQIATRPTAKVRDITPITRVPAANVATPEVREDWRDRLVAWMKAGAPKPQLPACPPILEVAARCAIDERDAGVLLACYGARLCGHDGATFADLVELTPGRWSEVLGHGTLGASGALIWHRSRVHLAPEVVAVLDGAAPIHCVLREGRANERLVRVVAPSGIELDAIAEWVAPLVGAVLAPNARGLHAPARFLFEARVRGISPLVPWRRAAWPRLGRGVIVVDDPRVAPELGPIAATWAVAAAA